MRKETRTLCYDSLLMLEAYCLDGIVQAFPNHSHDFYVMGHIVSGQRFLSCRGRECTLNSGDMVLFDPQDNHGCAQCGSAPFADDQTACRAEIEEVCRLIDTSYAEPLTPEQMCICSGLSRSTLLRAFTREKKMAPYRYLQTVRIGNVKRLLEQGVTPMEAALRTGFYDQSHFSKFFMQFIGLAPGTYRDLIKRGEKEHLHENRD